MAWLSRLLVLALASIVLAVPPPFPPPRHSSSALAPFSHPTPASVAEGAVVSATLSPESRPVESPVTVEEASHDGEEVKGYCPPLRVGHSHTVLPWCHYTRPENRPPLGGAQVEKRSDPLATTAEPGDGVSPVIAGLRLAAVAAAIQAQQDAAIAARINQAAAAGAFAAADVAAPVSAQVTTEATATATSIQHTTPNIPYSMLTPGPAVVKRDMQHIPPPGGKEWEAVERERFPPKFEHNDDEDDGVNDDVDDDE